LLLHTNHRAGRRQPNNDPPQDNNKLNNETSYPIMAKKKSKTTSSSRSEAATGGDATDSATLPDLDDDIAAGNNNDTATPTTHPVELLQVDTGDMIKVKQVLDEGVAASLLEYLPEHTAWDNLKLFLMFIACAFAMTAQFAPLPFPESRWILGGCGAIYFIISAILQLIQSFIDGDAILWTRPMDEAWWNGTIRNIPHHDDNDNTNDNDENDHYISLYKGKKFANADLKQYGLLVRSDFPRYSEFFTITIQFYIKKQNKSNDQKKNDGTDANSPPPAVSKTWSVGQFFDKEGYFDEVGLSMEVDKLFERFDKKQYDVVTKTKTESTTTSKAKPKKD
jgi:signal peptidase complex subunit 2